MALHDPPSVQQVTGLSPDGGGFLAIALPVDAGAAGGLLKVGGITLFERQRRQLRRLGADNAVTAGCEGEARHLPTLLIEASLVVDERLLAVFLAKARERGISARPLLAVGPDGEAGGLAWLPTGKEPASWAALMQCADRINLSDVDTYSPERRRHVPLMWERPADPAAARRATDALIAAAQKGCLDWPARFIHPPIENAGVRLLLSTPVTPNLVSLAAFLLGLYAAWCFATGALWTGLLIALAVGPIDGIDGKLARTRVEFSRWGDLEHAGDKVVEYAWFGSLAYAIGTPTSWALAALIVATALSEALLGEFYRRMTGAQLDDAGRFERAYRLVSGRRNTFFWCLLPFAWFDAWSAGLVMIAVYSTVNFAVMLQRFFVRLAEYGRANSAAIAANLDATAYGMLASPLEGGDDQAQKAGLPAGSLQSTGRLGVP